ncbi:hypothetical protein LIA77_04487 [Sarocladium implicatum]|nr:hypothetical protein LIA77_04487 [Sarocladium implicatum]
MSPSSRLAVRSGSGLNFPVGLTILLAFSFEFGPSLLSFVPALLSTSGNYAQMPCTKTQITTLSWVLSVINCLSVVVTGCP